MACLSRKQFEREFKTFVGMGPKRYTHIVRLQKAFLQHQKSTGINHAQIALASGYADQSHYIREFKKHCGYTPKSLPDDKSILRLIHPSRLMSLLFYHRRDAITTFAPQKQ